MSDFKDSTVPEICDLLTQLDDCGAMSRRQFEETFGMKARCGHDYYHKQEMKAGQMKVLFSHPFPGVKVEQVQQSLINFLFAGTAWLAYKPTPEPLSDDGDFDTRIAFDSAIKSTARVSEMMCEYKGADKAGLSRMEAEDAEALFAEINLCFTRLRDAAKAVHVLRRRTAAT